MEPLKLSKKVDNNFLPYKNVDLGGTLYSSWIIRSGKVNFDHFRQFKLAFAIGNLDNFFAFEFCMNKWSIQ